MEVTVTHAVMDREGQPGARARVRAAGKALEGDDRHRGGSFLVS